MTKSLKDQMERKKKDLRSILADMKGISPKLGKYKELEAKAKKIQEELASLGAVRLERKDGIRFIPAGTICDRCDMTREQVRLKQFGCNTPFTTHPTHKYNTEPREVKVEQYS